MRRAKKCMAFVGAVLLAFGNTGSAQAQIAINGVIRTITNEQRPIENVIVSNTSKDKILQVSISAAQAFIDAERKETTEATQDLLVAPQEMILRPGEKKQARLVLRTPPGDVERYYRVSFAPKIPEDIRFKALEITQAEEDPNNVQASLVVLSGVGMFITVSPKNPNPKLTWARDKTGITFKNEGNISVDMRQRRNYCFDGEKDCITLPDKRIYPGHSWHFEIAGDKPLVYYYKTYRRTNKAIVGAVE